MDRLGTNIGHGQALDEVWTFNFKSMMTILSGQSMDIAWTYFCPAHFCLDKLWTWTKLGQSMDI